jgi:hypothetical protein
MKVVTRHMVSLMGETMDKAFIARKYVSHEIGGRTYYEEGIFGSYESAYDFIRLISVEDNDSFLSEIVCYRINDMSPWEDEHIWTFDKTATLIYSFSARGEGGFKEQTRDRPGCLLPDSYTAKFTIGDIVLITPFPWNEVSPTAKNVLGVITETPASLEEWVTRGNDKNDWNSNYVVYRILGGYLDHIHVKERGIQPYQGTLPNNLVFLQDLSDQLHGKQVLTEEALKGAFAGNIFVERVRHLTSADYIGESQGDTVASV